MRIPGGIINGVTGRSGLVCRLGGGEPVDNQHGHQKDAGDQVHHVGAQEHNAHHGGNGTHNQHAQQHGQQLCGAPDYFPVACKAIDEMLRQVGPPRYDEGGMMTSGVIIRHLVLPGHVQNSLKVLDYIAEHFPKGSVLLSLMAQYVPSGRAKQIPPFDRTVTQEEYEAVVDWMYMLGLEDGFLQEPSAATDEYLPDFSLEGV